MRDLQLLRTDHYPAVLEFELANRAFFARSVPDRGDAYFAHIDERLDELLADQQAGLAAFYFLVDDSTVLGRFNLEFGAEATARLGYRVAERVCGHGVATATVLDVCRLAATRHGMRTVRAAAAARNVASQRVLIKAGFVLRAGRPGRPQRRDRDLVPARVGGRAGRPRLSIRRVPRNALSRRFRTRSAGRWPTPAGRHRGRQ